MNKYREELKATAKYLSRNFDINNMKTQLNLKYGKIHSVPHNDFLAIFSKRLWHWNCRRYWRKALKEVNNRLEELSWYSGVEKSTDPTISIKYKMLKSHQNFLQTALGKNVC